MQHDVWVISSHDISIEYFFVSFYVFRDVVINPLRTLGTRHNKDGKLEMSFRLLVVSRHVRGNNNIIN